MRSKKVTEAWEFYRDNCPGFNEPMRKKMRELDEYVADLEQFAKELLEYESTDFCEECPVLKECDEGKVETCVQVSTYANFLVRAAKLGIGEECEKRGIE